MWPTSRCLSSLCREAVQSAQSMKGCRKKIKNQCLNSSEKVRWVNLHHSYQHLLTCCLCTKTHDECPGDLFWHLSCIQEESNFQLMAGMDVFKCCKAISTMTRDWSLRKQSLFYRQLVNILFQTWFCRLKMPGIWNGHSQKPGSPWNELELCYCFPDLPETKHAG